MSREVVDMKRINVRSEKGVIKKGQEKKKKIINGEMR